MTMVITAYILPEGCQLTKGATLVPIIVDKRKRKVTQTLAKKTVQKRRKISDNETDGAIEVPEDPPKLAAKGKSVKKASSTQSKGEDSIDHAPTAAVRKDKNTHAGAEGVFQRPHRFNSNYMPYIITGNRTSRKRQRREDDEVSASDLDNPPPPKRHASKRTADNKANNQSSGSKADKGEGLEDGEKGVSRGRAEDDGGMYSVGLMHRGSLLYPHGVSESEVAPTKGRVSSRARLKEDTTKGKAKGRLSPTPSNVGEEDVGAPMRKSSSKRQARSGISTEDDLATRAEMQRNKRSLSIIEEDEELEDQIEKSSVGRPAQVMRAAEQDEEPVHTRKKKTVKRIGLLELDGEQPTRKPASSRHKLAPTQGSTDVPADDGLVAQVAATAHDHCDAEAQPKSTKPSAGRTKRGKNAIVNDEKPSLEAGPESGPEPEPPKKAKKSSAPSTTDADVPVKVKDKSAAVSKKKKQPTSKPCVDGPASSCFVTQCSLLSFRLKPSSKVQKENNQTANRGRKPKVRTL